MTHRESLVHILYPVKVTNYLPLDDSQQKFTNGGNMQVQFRDIPPAARPAATIERLETAFLAEMLKHAVPQGLPGPFGGGSGESQFASFRTEQLAQSLAGAIDLGLGRRLGGGDA